MTKSAGGLFFHALATDRLDDLLGFFVLVDSTVRLEMLGARPDSMFSLVAFQTNLVALRKWRSLSNRRGDQKGKCSEECGEQITGSGFHGSPGDVFLVFNYINLSLTRRGVKFMLANQTRQERFLQS